MDAAMIIPVEGLPEVTETFNIGKAIAERVQMTDGDIVAVSQKIVSKSEGRVVRLDETDPGRMPSRWPPGPARIRGWCSTC
jgi:coenzyme F420-0:L-glutamate ligase/coenzyme F420-1:gamma-L-glutamate ligase